jgi:hypothetical protein
MYAMGFARDYNAIVAGFDQLPDGAVIPDKAAAMVLGVHYLTLRKRNPIPQIKVTARFSGRRVGDIRALGRGAVVSPAPAIA